MYVCTHRILLCFITKQQCREERKKRRNWKFKWQKSEIYSIIITKNIFNGTICSLNGKLSVTNAKEKNLKNFKSNENENVWECLSITLHLFPLRKCCVSMCVCISVCHFIYKNLDFGIFSKGSLNWRLLDITSEWQFSIISNKTYVKSHAGYKRLFSTT